jgi:hypothetical protein
VCFVGPKKKPNETKPNQANQFSRRDIAYSTQLNSTASPILIRPDRAHLLFICSTCASALARARTKASSEFTSCDKEHCIVYNAPAREVSRQGNRRQSRFRDHHQPPTANIRIDNHVRAQHIATCLLDCNSYKRPRGCSYIHNG